MLCPLCSVAAMLHTRVGGISRATGARWTSDAMPDRYTRLSEEQQDAISNGAAAAATGSPAAVAPAPPPEAAAAATVPQSGASAAGATAQSHGRRSGAGTSPIVFVNPDGSASVSVDPAAASSKAHSGYDGKGTGGKPAVQAQQYAAAAAAAAGASPATATTTAGSVRLVVACPRCRLRLSPPPGAPVFACPCGQRMRTPHTPHTAAAGSFCCFGTCSLGLLKAPGACVACDGQRLVPALRWPVLIERVSMCQRGSSSPCGSDGAAAAARAMPILRSHAAWCVPALPAVVMRTNGTHAGGGGCAHRSNACTLYCGAHLSIISSAQHRRQWHPVECVGLYFVCRRSCDFSWRPHSCTREPRRLAGARGLRLNSSWGERPVEACGKRVWQFSCQFPAICSKSRPAHATAHLAPITWRVAH